MQGDCRDKGTGAEGLMNLRTSMEIRVTGAEEVRGHGGISLETDRMVGTLASSE
jgi:hypothetical protein